MDTQTTILIAIIAGVISLGMYRKSQVEKNILRESLAEGGGHVEDLDDTNLLLSNRMITKETAAKYTQNNVGVSRLQLARVLHSLERNLPEGDSVIQVYDYSTVSFGDGIQYTVDVMIFNSATTQSKTKRLTCSTDGTITSEFDISPVTGDIVKYKSSDDIMSDVVKSDSRESTGAKFIRDKYAFIDKSIDYDLPPEPERPLTNNPVALKSYHEAKALYEKQVKLLRYKKELNRRTIAFVPTTNQPVNADSTFPYEMPKSYGFAAVEETPIDYSQLSNIKPLEDEKFFNSIAQEKSAFNLQYN
jgi:hypothetical protein